MFFGLDRLALALAQFYGYRTLNSLVSANFGLIVVLVAFIIVALVFLRLLNRQFPRSGRQPVKTWIFKTTIVFFISAFVFICGFTVFYEKKKMEEHGSVYSESVYKV